MRISPRTGGRGGAEEEVRAHASSPRLPTTTNPACLDALRSCICCWICWITASIVCIHLIHPVFLVCRAYSTIASGWLVCAANVHH